MPRFAGFSPPSERIAIECAGYRLEVWPELAGGISRFEKIADGNRIIPLFQPAADQTRYAPWDMACWPLLPYSNRIRDGKFEFDGKTYELDKNMDGWSNTLHGMGWQRAWQEIARDSRSIRLGLDHPGDGDWPFAFSAEQNFSLDTDGLAIVTTLKNVDSRAQPAGLGQHPRIVRPAGTAITAPVRQVWMTDNDVMPTRRIDLPGNWDLPKGCLLDGNAMDHCFTELSGPVEIKLPGRDSLQVTASDNLKFLVVYNPLHENFVCVEPVTHMTDAINRVAQGFPDEETGFFVLRPGDTMETTHRFSYRPAPG